MPFRQFLVALVFLGVAGCGDSEISLVPVNLAPASDAITEQGPVMNEDDSPGALTVGVVHIPDQSAIADANDEQESIVGTPFIPAIAPQSMQQFSRAMFADSADDEPVPVDTLDFVQDADHDEFADLLAE